MKMHLPFFFSGLILMILAQDPLLKYDLDSLEPSIYFPLNFESRGFIRSANPKQHDPIMEMTILPSLDSEGNRAKCLLQYFDY